MQGQNNYDKYIHTKDLYTYQNHESLVEGKKNETEVLLYDNTS